ncbi:MAG: hypothetical protein SFW63_05695 [Alphaproteobacteria bacterium]|nr:hypothetical protein [Alphaproteobacteria bacterium]
METSSAQEKIWRALEKAAKADIDAIQSSIKSTTDPDRIRSLMAALGNVPLPPGSRLATLVAGIIASAEEKLYDSMVSDKLRTESLIASLPRFSDLREDRAFTRATYQFFNDQERRYFESIDPSRIYRLQSFDANGNAIAGATKEVSGAELREDFARLKFHTLSAGEQKKVRDDAAKMKVQEANLSDENAAAPKPETNAQKPSLQDTAEEMTALGSALDNQRDFKATEIAQKRGSSSAAREEIAVLNRQVEQAKETAEDIKNTALAGEKSIREKEEKAKDLDKISKAGVPIVSQLATLAKPVAEKVIKEEKEKIEETIGRKEDKLRKEVQGVVDYISDDVKAAPNQSKDVAMSKEEKPTLITGGIHVDDVTAPSAYAVVKGVPQHGLG